MPFTRSTMAVFFWLWWAWANVTTAQELAPRSVILQSRMAQSVEISAKPDAWNDADILVQVPNGTIAEVIGQRTFRPTLSQEVIVYQVKAMHQEKEYIGWVRATSVQEKPSTQSAAPVPIKEIDARPCAPILERYGPSPIASVIHGIRKGSLTVELNIPLEL